MIKTKIRVLPLKLKLWTVDHDRNTLWSWWTVPLDVGTYKQFQSTTAYLIPGSIFTQFFVSLLIT